MCLSDVYVASDGEKKLVMKSAATIKVEGDTLTFTNILGLPTTVKGTIEKVDLMENYVIIKEK